LAELVKFLLLAQVDQVEQEVKVVVAVAQEQCSTTHLLSSLLEL
jgi:hypothetical protein